MEDIQWKYRSICDELNMNPVVLYSVSESGILVSTSEIILSHFHIMPDGTLCQSWPAFGQLMTNKNTP